jgi:hypothetical protein
MGYVSEFSALSPRIRSSRNQRLLLEISCIKLCRREEAPQSKTGSVSVRTMPAPTLKKSGDTRESPAAKPAEPERPKAEPENLEDVKPKPAEPAPQAAETRVKKVINGWGGITEKADKTLRVFLNKAEPRTLNDGVLYLVCDNVGIFDYLKGKQSEISGLINDGKPGFGIQFALKRDFEGKTRLAPDADKYKTIEDAFGD